MPPFANSGYQQSGSVLVVVLVFLLVLGAMAMSGLERAQLAQRLEFNFSDRGRAFHAAESALIVAEQVFREAALVDGVPAAVARWPLLDGEKIQCATDSQSAGNPSVSELSGFDMLANSPGYQIQSGRFPMAPGPNQPHEAVEPQLPYCGELYLAQSCGYGRRIQTVVQLQLRVYACCDVQEGCLIEEFYGYQRSLTELSTEISTELR